MDEIPLEPEPPERPSAKPKYLPRMAYQPPELALDEEEDPAAPASSKLAKEKPKDSPSGKSSSKVRKKPDDEKEKKGVLLEATPELDTYESRKRIRLIIGGIAASVLALGLFLVLRAIRSSNATDTETDLASAPDPHPVAAKPMESPKVREAQAKQLLDDARLFERAGKLDLALDRVQRVIDGYGEVPSANLARDARKRNEEGLPLFVTGTAVIATKAEPEAPAEPEPEPPAVAANVEIVSPSAPPAVVAVPEPMLPRVEPRRVTGVGLPRSNVAARPLPSGFHAREEAGVHESGWPLEITCDRDGGTMVLVLGSTFTQGRDDGRPEERPAHKITLPSYYIDQHEVTANQFKAFRDDYALSGDKPAVQISLADAREYAQWAGKSLPTEAQWEMAARTSDGRIYPWGNSKPEWGRPRTPKQIDPVMSFPGDLSPYGVFDLSGNAWEWTNDWFDTKYYGTLKGRVTANPAGPAQGKSRIPEVVIKGGSKEWDGSWRTGMRPEAKLPHLGFRCVLNIEGVPAAGAPGTRVEPSRPGSGTPF